MIKKIFRFLGSIAKDLWMHFALGTAVALWMLLVGCLVSFAFGLALSTLGCLALAFWKEWYDRRHGRVFDCIDLVATIAGGSQVWFVAALICNMVAA